MLGKPYGKKLKIVKLAYILQKPKFLIKIVLFLSFKNNATFQKKLLQTAWCGRLCQYHGKRGEKTDKLKYTLWKTLFEKSSDPDSCEIEKCTMRNHQIVLTNRFVMHN